MIHCGVRIQPDIYPTFQILCGTHFSVLSNIIVNNLLLTNIYEMLWFITASRSYLIVSTRLSQSAELTLALLVLRILANYSDTTFSLDDFALLANGFYRWSYFHRKNPPFTSFVLRASSTTGFWSGKMPKNKAFLVPDLTNLPKTRT